MGRVLFNQLGIAVTQCSFSPGNQVNAILPTFELKELIEKTFPNLISHVGKSKTHVLKLNFHKKFQSRHQKGRRIPMNLQDKVNIELKKMLDEKHIIKFTNCPDKNFISPIIVTVKKDQTIKLAMDSKF